MGVSNNRGTPKWMVKVMEHQIFFNWMIGGYGTLFLETPIYIYIINHCFLDPYERTRMTHGKYPAWLIGWNINSPWVVGWVKNSYMDGGWNGAPINGRKWMGSWGSCLGYMSGMKSYPVMWGLWQKPWNKDPIIKQFLAVHFLTSLGWPGGRMVVNDLFRRLLFLGLGGIGMYWVYVYIYIHILICIFKYIYICTHRFPWSFAECFFNDFFLLRLFGTVVPCSWFLKLFVANQPTPPPPTYPPSEIRVEITPTLLGKQWWIPMLNASGIPTVPTRCQQRSWLAALWCDCCCIGSQVSNLYGGPWACLMLLKPNCLDWNHFFGSSLWLFQRCEICSEAALSLWNDQGFRNFCGGRVRNFWTYRVATKESATQQAPFFVHTHSKMCRRLLHAWCQAHCFPDTLSEQ